MNTADMYRRLEDQGMTRQEADDAIAEQEDFERRVQEELTHEQLINQGNPHEKV